MKRTRLKPRSKRSIQADLSKAVIREAVFLRDGYCCIMSVGVPGAPGCSGPLTPHHLRKASQGGAYEMENLVTLCSGHNTWVEDNPWSAHRLGLVCRNGETLDECWDKLRAARLVP